MNEVILFPTETVYGLGVNALNKTALEQLFKLKGRDLQKAVSWLVRDIADIEKYAEISPIAAKIAEQFLPGPLTLVLPALDEYKIYASPNGTIGFRISTDTIAQKLIADFMQQHNAPLTCTSANVSGLPALSSVPEILNQFCKSQTMITKVYDDGPRAGLTSTVIEIIGSEARCLREGACSWANIKASIL
jgi:L-threonylcarbamoyladenylate synthase